MVISDAPIINREDYPMMVVSIKSTEEAAKEEVKKLKGEHPNWMWSFDILREEFEIDTSNISLQE